MIYQFQLPRSVLIVQLLFTKLSVFIFKLQCFFVRYQLPQNRIA